MTKRVMRAVFSLCLLIGGYISFTIATLPNMGWVLNNGVTPSPTSQILARDKTLIRAYGKFHHQWVPLSEIPLDLIDALLSTEDRRFYQHEGIDLLGILRASVQNILSQGIQEGGSTLTQQLARNAFLSNELSIDRKVKEVLLARKLEQKLSKREILELYLNNVYFGEGAYGIGAASRIYFGKSPGGLDKAECALLVGLLQAPSRYNPFNNPGLAISRRNEVLQNMVETQKLSANEAEIMKNGKLQLNPDGKKLASTYKAPFFSQHVLKQALDLLDMDERTFWQKGIKVYTTLDPDAQEIAEGQITRYNRAYGNRNQFALLSLNRDAGIIAYVGGKDFINSQYDRVSQSRRSVGSLFKIFVYTTAIKNGISPLAVYEDSPVQYGSWRPENYDKAHHGYMTLAHAFVKSNNVVAVKLLEEISPEEVIQTAREMGIESEMQPNLSLALGAVEMSLKEITAAFNVLNNKGAYIEPYAIERIVGRYGELLYEHIPYKKSVLTRPARDTMVELMQGVVRYGTGRAAVINHPSAGKTGTSDDHRDAWFIGFTPEVTTGVWVGNDDNSPIVGITGGTLPANIWQSYMSRLTVGTDQGDFELVEGYALGEQDFLALNTDTYREPNPSWHEKVYGLRKRFHDWLNHTLGREIPTEIYEEMRTHGVREWEVFKKEVRDYLKEIDDYKK